jgi:hypothetical protein
MENEDAERERMHGERGCKERERERKQREREKKKRVRKKETRERVRVHDPGGQTQSKERDQSRPWL